MIPETAVEAAARYMHDFEGYFDLFEDAPEYRREEFCERARSILEAAAPHMLGEATEDALRAAWDRGYAMAIDGMKDIPEQAWDEGANAAWERSTPEVNGAHYVWRSEGDPVNPYRPTA